MEKYDVIVSQKNVDWCKVSEFVSDNYFLKLFIKDFQTSNAGRLTQICGELGEFKVYNISFEDSAVIAIWPTGNYRGNLLFHDEDDRAIFNVTYFNRVIHK